MYYSTNYHINDNLISPLSRSFRAKPDAVIKAAAATMVKGRMCRGKLKRCATMEEVFEEWKCGRQERATQTRVTVSLGRYDLRQCWPDRLFAWLPSCVALLWSFVSRFDESAVVNGLCEVVIYSRFRLTTKKLGFSLFSQRPTWKYSTIQNAPLRAPTRIVSTRAGELPPQVAQAQQCKCDAQDRRCTKRISECAVRGGIFSLQSWSPGLFFGHLKLFSLLPSKYFALLSRKLLDSVRYAAIQIIHGVHRNTTFRSPALRTQCMRSKQRGYREPHPVAGARDARSDRLNDVREVQTHYQTGRSAEVGRCEGSHLATQGVVQPSHGFRSCGSEEGGRHRSVGTLTSRELLVRSTKP